jgi:hypothetical protein
MTLDLVHTLIRTGVIEEIARTILETTIAIRDIANEVNETVKDLKERGTIKDIASAVVETTNETRYNWNSQGCNRCRQYQVVVSAEKRLSTVHALVSSSMILHTFQIALLTKLFQWWNNTDTSNFPTSLHLLTYHVLIKISCKSTHNLIQLNSNM